MCVILVSSLTATCPCVHVSKTVAKCFASLWRLRSIRRSVSQSVALSLVTALTTTQLDYGGATRKCDHVTHLLRDLHWLRVPERIQFRLAIQVYRCRHNLASLYLANDLHWTDESEAVQRLRSGTRQRLIVPRTRQRTIGDRAFGIADWHVWNSLPPVVTSASSLPSFKRQLKTFLFKNSFP